MTMEEREIKCSFCGRSEGECNEIIGAKGMVGTALVNNLKNIRDGKNRTSPNYSDFYKIKTFHSYQLLLQY